MSGDGGMYRQAIKRCAGLSLAQVALIGLLIAAVLELLTVWMRFGLGLQSTRDTSLIGALTLGIRIHHGYIGLVLLLFAWWFDANLGLRNILLMLGVGLLVSDFIHHFLVLWPITGSPQFDLVYPSR